MFIATSARHDGPRSVRSETLLRNLQRGRRKRLRSYGASEQRKDCLAINMSLLWTEAINSVLLYFQVESAAGKGRHSIRTLIFHRYEFS